MNELILTHHWLNSMLYLYFLAFPPSNILFLLLDTLQETKLHITVMSRWAPLGCDSFTLFLFFMILTVLRRAGQVFAECPLGFVWCFSHDQTVSGGVLEGRACATETKCHFCHLKIEGNIIDVPSPRCWLWSPASAFMFLGHLHFEVTLYPFPCGSLWQEVSMYSLHMRSHGGY